MKLPFEGNYQLTQKFGENPDAYIKFGMLGHNGLDYALPTGTKVLAPHFGKVIEVVWDPSGYGLYIKIENDKEGSVLAHLKENYISVGAEVTEGQLIASSNNTGNSTGPHLHWGYYRFPRDRNNGYAGFIDQLPFLTPPEPLEDIEKLKDKIADLEATEKRLIQERDQIVREYENKIQTLLADKDKECRKKLEEMRKQLHIQIDQIVK